MFEKWHLKDWNLRRISAFLGAIDGLEVGLYNYTLIVSDKGGNTAIDTVFVSVIPNTNPTSTSSTNSATAPTLGDEMIVLIIGGLGLVILIAIIVVVSRRR